MTSQTQSQRHTIKLMDFFNKEILKCTSLDDYMSLVFGIMIFSELVLENFKELSAKDASEEDCLRMIKELKEAAVYVAADAITRNDSELETHINNLN